MEIERKFLVGQGAPTPDRSASTPLRQGYLVIADSGEARIRDAGGCYTLTIKTGMGLVRSEHEIELTSAQFETLWPATEARRLEKRRYRLPVGEHVCELDVYVGSLEGLVTVEVEFQTVESASHFAVPPWFGPEVTGVSGYTNAELSLKGIPKDGPNL